MSRKERIARTEAEAATLRDLREAGDRLADALLSADSNEQRSSALAEWHEIAHEAGE